MSSSIPPDVARDDAYPDDPAPARGSIEARAGRPKVYVRDHKGLATGAVVVTLVLSIVATLLVALVLRLAGKYTAAVVYAKAGGWTILVALVLSAIAAGIVAIAGV